jgi:hypothetical protein
MIFTLKKFSKKLKRIGLYICLFYLFAQKLFIHTYVCMYGVQLQMDRFRSGSFTWLTLLLTMSTSPPIKS